MRVLQLLGVRSMVFTNAAGGINWRCERGGLVLISRPHQPAGRQSAGRAERRDARAALSRYVGGLLARVTARSRKRSRRSLGSRLTEGVYAAMLGPSYETPAEIRYPAHHRRGPGGHVHRARSDRGESHGDEGARRSRA